MTAAWRRRGFDLERGSLFLDDLVVPAAAAAPELRCRRPRCRGVGRATTTAALALALALALAASTCCCCCCCRCWAARLRRPRRREVDGAREAVEEVEEEEGEAQTAFWYRSWALRLPFFRRSGSSETKQDAPQHREAVSPSCQHSTEGNKQHTRSRGLPNTFDHNLSALSVRTQYKHGLHACLQASLVTRCIFQNIAVHRPLPQSFVLNSSRPKVLRGAVEKRLARCVVTTRQNTAGS